MCERCTISLLHIQYVPMMFPLTLTMMVTSVVMDCPLLPSLSTSVAESPEHQVCSVGYNYHVLAPTQNEGAVRGEVAFSINDRLKLSVLHC